MTTDATENHDAARRDGSRLSEGLGPDVIAWVCEYESGEVFVSLAKDPMNDQNVRKAWRLLTLRQRDEQVEATRNLFRTALLEEAAQWTGDYRVPAHRALCDAAKRARVPLTMDECYLATKRA
jgi:hypothetical protein